MGITHGKSLLWLQFYVTLGYITNTFPYIYFFTTIDFP